MMGKPSYRAPLALSQQDFLLSPSSHQAADPLGVLSHRVTAGAVIFPGERPHASSGRNAGPAGDACFALCSALHPRIP